MAVPIQVTRVANDIARPLILVGYISERITHTTGPSEKEKEAIKIKRKHINRYPEVIFSLNNKPVMVSEINIPQVPVINNGFLPILSIFHIAIKVKIIFMNPIITCPPSASLRVNPACSRIFGP